MEARQCIHITIATGVGHTRLLDILIDATRCGIAEPLTIQVRPCDLVIHAKNQVAELTGLALDSQRLTLSGHTLANERRLCDCGIRENSILQVTCTIGAASAPNPSVAVSGCRAPRAQMDACAKKHRCQGEWLFLTILQTWPPQCKKRLWLQKARTVGQLKERLKEFFQVSSDQQILVHSGRRLQNHHTLEYYNLEGGECIQLMVQGGPRVAAGPVALRAESPTYVTLPLPPKPVTKEAQDWVPRALPVTGSTPRRLLKNSDEESAEATQAEGPVRPLQLQEPQQDTAGDEPAHGEGEQGAETELPALLEQVSMALLAHAMAR